MTFVLRMAAREIRASWKRLLFFFLCIAIGVASIVAIRSVIQGVRGALAGQARALLASDALVTSNRPWTPTVLDRLRSETDAGRIVARSQAVEVATMVRPTGRQGALARMVELRAVEGAFPFYGTLTLDGQTYSHALLRNRGAVVRPELLAQFGLKVGDRLQIGQQEFEVRGTIEAEPGRRLGAFTLGPRVFIDLADLESTGLLAFGSRASHQMLLRVPEAALEPLVDDLREAFSNEFVSVRHYRRTEDRVEENLTRAEDYLSLVGLVVLILGGIGISSVTRVFVQQKLRSIAVLKCIGSTSSQVLAVYMSQVLLLGLAGSALGVAMAAGVMAALPPFLGELAAILPANYGLTASAVLQGLSVGLLVAILFSVVPLLDVRHVKPSLLLREAARPASGIDWVKWGVTAAVGVALVGVASWQAGSFEVGLMLSGGLIATLVVLHLAGLLLVRAVQPLRHARSFALRHAVLHVIRPGSQTRIILLAVGLGAFFILGVRSVQANLLRDFAIQVGPDAPDLFLIDIQQDQRDAAAAFLDEENGAAPPPRLMPVLRARVVGVEGREVNLDSYEAVRRGRGLSREYTVTYRSHLEANETVIAGEWWGDAPLTGEPEVSIEEEVADAVLFNPDGPRGRGAGTGEPGRGDGPGNMRRADIQVGDRMRFDVLGRVVTARVASVRRVEWQDFRAGGFVFVFRPGSFEGVPHTYISAFQGPPEPDARARMQAGLVARFPNISVIDLREVLQAFQAIVNNVTLAVTVVGALVLLSGALILVGAVSMTKFRRVYEAAILKTLGANGRLIATMLLLEYGVLGAIAGTIGALGAIVLSWAIATHALDFPWEWTASITFGGIGLTAAFVAAVGVLASLDVLRHKPLATLRAE
jgi:putative ABC transport system permease protein